MTNKYIPAIGTAGFYELLAPFDALMAPGERYTLKAIRAISEYIAENEDPKADIYAANDIEAEYDADFKADSEILSLQSDKGHWLHVPVSKIKCYPILNGIPYRVLQIVLPLRPIPVDTDLTTLFSRLSDVTTSVLGFPVTPQSVEGSRTILVSSENHLAKQIERRLAMEDYTEGEVISRQNAQITVLLQRIQDLQTYIQDNIGPPP